MVRVTVYAQFYRGGKGKPSVLPFCTEAGQLVAKTLGFLRHHSQLLSLPTCSLLKYKFSAHLGFWLISWASSLLSRPLPWQTGGWLLWSLGCTAAPLSSPHWLNRGHVLRSMAQSCSLPSLPGTLFPRSRCCCSSADLGVPGTDCQLCHLPTCSTPHVESELLRVGPSICMSKKLPWWFWFC